MASDTPAKGSAGPHHPDDQWWPVDQPDGGPALDLTFDAGALPKLRAEMRAYAGKAGLPEGRPEDVVLAIHELAANSICHDGGIGRLRVWNLAGALRCQLDDGELLEPAGPGDDPARPGCASGQRQVNSLPRTPGHGLWVVQQVADQMRTMSCSHGTSVIAIFGRKSPHYRAGQRAFW